MNSIVRYIWKNKGVYDSFKSKRIHVFCKYAIKNPQFNSYSKMRVLYVVLWRLLTELIEYFDKHIPYLGKITLTEYVQGLSTCFNPLHVSVDYTTRVKNLCFINVWWSNTSGQSFFWHSPSHKRFSDLVFEGIFVTFVDFVENLT